MRQLFRLCCIVLWMSACSDNEPAPVPRTQETPLAMATQAPYLATGDYATIAEHGALRLIAPRFDGADALPRGGISVLAYQRLAEQFAASLRLDVKWVFVDGFDRLIPTLEAGEGDLIVTNMTVTEARKARVSFAHPIARIAELVISHKSHPLTAPGDLAGGKISVPAGTAYLETLRERAGAATLEVVDGNTSDSDLLSGIVAGDYHATVIDSDIAGKLLPIYPDLMANFPLRKNRPIAWAVRKDNPVLLRKLNQFLVSHHVSETANQSEKRTWQAIKASGRLRMLTLNNPASYFMWRGELMGFDYELMKAFADQHELHLTVIIKDNIPQLFEALKSGEGDVIAASLTQSVDRQDLGIHFTVPYLKVSEQVVGRLDGPKVTSLDQLRGRIIGVNPDTVFYSRLQSSLHGDETIKTVDNATTEELITRMAAGDFDFTVADSHLVAIEKSYHQNVEVNFDLTEESPIAWGIRPDQPALKGQLNTFIKKQYRGLFYNVVFNKYFKNDRKIKRYQEGRLVGSSDLSPFDDIVKRYADAYRMDWRLLVAQMYQESKFNPKAKSFAGARGLMQVMPRTAKEFGFAELDTPEKGIAAGVVYMNWLANRFPGELDFQERIYFTLAAYNAGIGHVRDARTLTRQLGLDPNRWFDNVEQAMLKLANPQYYKKARFGYVRGSEPVAYVRAIRDRYLGYLGSRG